MIDPPHGEARQWQRRIEASLGAWRRIRRAEVLAETGSTMDAARQLGLEDGLLVATLRQTAGRGREGRAWLEAGEGVAVTLAVAAAATPRSGDGCELLPLAAAVAAARCLERELGSEAVGIKWPNDLLVGGRKIGGILIERSGGFALIGVGLNLLQRAFPPELSGTATSVWRERRGEGSPIDRLSVTIALLGELDRALSLPRIEVLAEWGRREALAGCTARVRCGEQVWEGTIRGIEPLEWIEIEAAGSRIRLPAAQCSVLDFDRQFGR